MLDVLGSDPYAALDAMLEWAHREINEHFMDPDRRGYIHPNAHLDPHFRYVDKINMTIRTTVLAEFDWDIVRQSIDPDYDDAQLILISCQVVQLMNDEHWSNKYPDYGPPYKDSLTELAIHLSLCPLHFVDWAICFDDADPGCSQIREIYPNSHDT